METELSELERMEQDTFEEDDSMEIPPSDFGTEKNATNYNVKQND